MRTKLRLRWHEALLKAGFTATLCEDLSYSYQLNEPGLSNAQTVYVSIGRHVVVKGRGDIYAKTSQNKKPERFAELLAKVIRAEADLLRNMCDIPHNVRFSRGSSDRSYTTYVDERTYARPDDVLSAPEICCANENKQRMAAVMALLLAMARATHLGNRKDA